MAGLFDGLNKAVRRPMTRRAIVAAVVASVATTVAIMAQQRPDFRDSPFLRIDPERVVLSDRDARVPCGECHESEYEVWRETGHATGFETMHRTPDAQDILQKMDLTVTKRQESLCMRCHYTVGSDRRAIAGVSCESCHGPGRDWINVHNTWGEGVDTPEGEAPGHRDQRIAQSVEGGMLRPSGNLYAVAANCFECHTVPIEDLVNRGGHRSGSARFELVERVADIRHNFVHEQWGGEPGNREPTAERMRVMYTVGKILAYEFALRGMAAATTEERYSKSMERRIQQSYRELEAVARAADVPAVNQILQVGATLRIVPGNGDALLAAAERIRAIGQQFAASVAPATLASLDPLISGAGVPAEAEPTDETPPPVTTAPTPAPTTSAAPPTTTAATDTGSGPGRAGGAEAPAQPAAAAAPDLPGRIRNRPAWFPAVDGRYRTIDPGCNCHEDAEAWWFDNAHEGTAARLNNREPLARQIATLYGVGPDQMARGDRICMSCHGTAPSDAPSAEVLTGVGCERCHGPSSEFLEPHENGGNPQLGMVALKQPGEQAKICLNCHRITDERLLAAGHPSGQQYDLVSATGEIVHWPDSRPERARSERGEGAYSGPDNAALRAAFDREVAARPIPSVTVVAAPPPAPSAGNAGAVPTPRQPRVSAGEVRERGAPATASLPPRPPPARTRPDAAGRVIDIAPMPAGVDTLTSEELLLLVKLRLERLLTLLGRGN